MAKVEFNPNIEDVTLPFAKVMYIPDLGDKIIKRDGVNLKVCHSYNPPDCFDCVNSSCKFAGEKGRELEEFWNNLEQGVDNGSRP